MGRKLASNTHGGKCCAFHAGFPALKYIKTWGELHFPDSTMGPAEKTMQGFNSSTQDPCLVQQ